jgi:hypothetical protein
VSDRIYLQHIKDDLGPFASSAPSWEILDGLRRDGLIVIDEIERRGVGASKLLTRLTAAGEYELARLNACEQRRKELYAAD